MSNADAINVTKDQIQAFNDKDWGKWLSLTADNCIYDEIATQNKIEGSEKIVEVMKAWKEAFPNVKGTGLNGEQFTEKCLNEAGVAMIPGTAFGKFAIDNVRFNFATSRENISKAIEKIHKILK